MFRARSCSIARMSLWAMALALGPPFITIAVVVWLAKAASSGQTPGPKWPSLGERPQK